MMTEHLGPQQFDDLPDMSFREAMQRPCELCSFDENMLREIERKAEHMQREVRDLQLSMDQIKAVVAYTYNDASGSLERQPYFCLNNDMRKRTPADRKALKRNWGALLKLLLWALDKLPDVEAEVFRGLEHRAVVEREYRIGRPIQWGAFTSTALDVLIALGFVDQQNGVVLRLQTTSAKDIRRLSFFPHENELLLSPNAVFRASTKPTLCTEGALAGWVVLDMVQDSGVQFYS